MLNRRSLLVLTATVLTIGLSAARASDDDALLQLLVRKHIITPKEATEVSAELQKKKSEEQVATAKTSSADKLKLSTSLTELEIYGDARVRYEVRNGQTAAPDPINPPGDTFQRDRARYRLRLGLRGTLADDWFFGIRLETSTNPRSTNVTFGDDTAAGPGPFAKNSDSVNVGQAYLGYKGFKGLTLTAGKMQNPFTTTSMVWDPDINPEGLSEQYKYTIELGGAPVAQTETVSDKDGKTVVMKQSVPASGPTLDLFANFGQFVYDDTNPNNPIGPQPDRVPTNNAYMLGWQIGAKYSLNKDTFFLIAPTLYNYTGHGDTFNLLFVGDPTFIAPDGTKVTPNQTGINSLLVVEIPAEFDFKVGAIPARVFGDFACNLEGAERARAAGHPDKSDQKYAYQIGAGVGGTKHKGDFGLTAFWQHAEQYALDPNLVDSDVFDSRVNMEGVFVTLGYAVTNAVTANLTYAHGWQIDHALGTGGVGDIGINPLDDYNLFQADLSFKF